MHLPMSEDKASLCFLFVFHFLANAFVNPPTPHTKKEQFFNQHFPHKNVRKFLTTVKAKESTFSRKNGGYQKQCVTIGMLPVLWDVLKMIASINGGIVFCEVFSFCLMGAFHTCDNNRAHEHRKQHSSTLSRVLEALSLNSTHELCDHRSQTNVLIV